MSCWPSLRSACECEAAKTWIDFEESSVERYLQCFDRICAAFVPWMLERLGAGRRVAEKHIATATVAGTPLFGCLDLLLVDNEAKTACGTKKAKAAVMQQAYEEWLMANG